MGNITFPATFLKSHSGVVTLNGQDHTQILFPTTFPTSFSIKKTNKTREIFVLFMQVET